jgi:hypothetical protein
MTSTQGQSSDKSKEEEEKSTHVPSWRTPDFATVIPRTSVGGSTGLAVALKPGHDFVAWEKKQPGPIYTTFSHFIRPRFLPNDVLFLGGCGTVMAICSLFRPLREWIVNNLPKNNAIFEEPEKKMALGAIGFSVAAVINCLIRVGSFILTRRRAIRKEFEPHEDVREKAYFTNRLLYDSAPSSKIYSEIVSQQREGFCGHSTCLSILHSCHLQSLPITPSRPEPLDVVHIVTVMNTFFGEKNVVAYPAPMEFEEFTKHCRLSGDPKWRYAVNYVRAPLFFTDPNGSKDATFTHKVSGGGHFSVISGTVVDPDSNEELVLLNDVNQNYGNNGRCLVPLRTFYDAVNTRSFAGDERGFVCVDVSSKMGSSPIASTSTK